MRKIGTFVFLACFAVAAVAWQGAAHQHKYDPANETVLRGTIEKIVEERHDDMVGIHFEVQTEDGKKYEVHAGPKKFLERRKLSLEIGDTVVVTGARAAMNGKEAVLAREIRKSGNVFTLRDQRGIPEWSRGYAKN